MNRGTRVSEFRKSAIIAKVERLVKSGNSINSACDASGIADTTFRKWRKQLDVNKTNEVQSQESKDHYKETIAEYDRKLSEARNELNAALIATEKANDTIKKLNDRIGDLEDVICSVVNGELDLTTVDTTKMIVTAVLEKYNET